MRERKLIGETLLSFVEAFEKASRSLLVRVLLLVQRGNVVLLTPDLRRLDEIHLTPNNEQIDHTDVRHVLIAQKVLLRERSASTKARLTSPTAHLDHVA